MVPVGANRATSISNVKDAGQSGDHNPKGDRMNVKTAQDRAAAMSKADELAAQAKAGELDDAGKTELAGLVEEVKAFDERVSKALESKTLIDAVAALGGEPKTGEDGEKSGEALTGRKYLAFSGRKARAMSGNLSKAMLGGVGTKALVSSGSVVTGTPLENQSPIELQRIPTSLLDVLPVKVHGTPRYRYLRQTSRDNQAAPWTSGAKPESSYGIESVDAELTVIAHVSDGLNEYDVLDNAELAGFVEAEMLHGLRRAVEAQVIGGSGTAPNLRGILNTSGIVVQAFATDLVTTTRKAITALESAAFVPHAFAMAPQVWEAISLQRNTGGSFDLATLPWIVRLSVCMVCRSWCRPLCRPVRLCCSISRRSVWMWIRPAS